MRIGWVSWAVLALAAAGGLGGCASTYAAGPAIPMAAPMAIAAYRPMPHVASVAARRRHHERHALRRTRPLFEEAPDETEWYNPPMTAGE